MSWTRRSRWQRKLQTEGSKEVEFMAQTSLLRPEGLVQSPAFTHVAVVPRRARRPSTSAARTPSTAMARSSAATTPPRRPNR